MPSTIRPGEGGGTSEVKSEGEERRERREGSNDYRAEDFLAATKRPDRLAQAFLPFLASLLAVTL
jgi:hypothetical protein